MLTIISDDALKYFSSFLAHNISYAETSKEKMTDPIIKRNKGKSLGLLKEIFITAINRKNITEENISLNWYFVTLLILMGILLFSSYFLAVFHQELY